MIKAILLDLDDTLLATNTDVFIRHYLDLLVAFTMRRFGLTDEAALRTAIRESVRAMRSNLDPTRNNEQVGIDQISARLDIDGEAWRAMMSDFIATDYQQLGDLVKPVAEARPLVDRLFRMDVAVVIATNPIFPRDAIDQRMAWAGIDGLPYALVTTAEEMHFTKPMPHYYEEILARVGHEPDEAIMIGDHPEMDISAAHRAGLATYWISADGAWNAAVGDPVAAGQGTLAQFSRDLDNGWLNGLPPRPFNRDHVIPRMIGNIGALHGLVSTIRPNYWHMRPDSNEWSPMEVLVHLRDSERTVQRPRLERIAAEDNPFISPPKAPPPPGDAQLQHQDGWQVLTDLWAERCQTINFLDSLPAAAWERPARHSVFGPTSLLELALFTTRHDHLHINQLCQTVGKCAQQ